MKFGFEAISGPFTGEYRATRYGHPLYITSLAVVYESDGAIFISGSNFSVEGIPFKDFPVRLYNGTKFAVNGVQYIAVI